LTLIAGANELWHFTVQFSRLVASLQSLDAVNQSKILVQSISVHFCSSVVCIRF